MLKLEVLGHLGQDSIVNNVNGKNCLNFSIAHSESYTDNQGQKQTKTVWISCNWWLEKTNIAQYLKKGTQALVTGYPEIKTYVDKLGKTVYQQTLRVREVHLCGGNSNNQSQGSSEQNFKDKVGDKPTQFQDDSAPF